MKPVDLFHIGPQKSGTSWLFRALIEHPQIACPPEDSIHYFDMFYVKGRSWYEEQFASAEEGQLLFDPTPSYIRSPWAAERMAKENPNARIIFCLRDPIERAFSHYWHERKKKAICFSFAEALSNYDLFSSWIETGFYARHLERYLDFFPKEQILAQRFETLEDDPRAFLKEALDFFGVSADFEPAVLNKRVNAAGARRDVWNRGKAAVNKIGLRVTPKQWRRTGLDRVFSGRDEYLRGVPEEIRARLLEVFAPETERLENLLGMELTAWKASTSSSPELPVKE